MKYTSEFSTVMTSLYWTMPSILKFLTNNQNTMYLVYWANIKSHLTSGLPKAEIFGRNRIFLPFGFQLRPPKFYSRYSAFGFVLKMTWYTYPFLIKACENLPKLQKTTGLKLHLNTKVMSKNNLNKSPKL